MVKRTEIKSHKKYHKYIFNCWIYIHLKEKILPDLKNIYIQKSLTTALLE